MSKKPEAWAGGGKNERTKEQKNKRTKDQKNRGQKREGTREKRRDKRRDSRRKGGLAADIVENETKEKRSTKGHQRTRTVRLSEEKDKGNDGRDEQS